MADKDLVEKNLADKNLVEKTKETAARYFKGVKGEKPFELWRSFDKDLARDMSLYITGTIYSRKKIPHTTRQLVTVAALTVLDRPEELKLHIEAALNVGCKPREISEVMFQTSVYGGVPAMNTALKVLRTVLEEKGLWPLD
ncbi:PcaC [Desulforapulum autotrophicum HRM2]|uniref:PcaC n=1 Tax=Desulforapulum autotrophicum (strain ATCC 43914 / DSM 3382 / VKM B-1955 / HRM2) TaxID=177437 RepID=C0QBB0_DESAH|nr:carboxymuconolactone decarboxylase family protein [Desulforapulum autotrophicum]ACN16912.1 PcaC [Desulforapulum autotrophicum HRM2]